MLTIFGDFSVGNKRLFLSPPPSPPASAHDFMQGRNFMFKHSGVFRTLFRGGGFKIFLEKWPVAFAWREAILRGINNNNNKYLKSIIQTSSIDYKNYYGMYKYNKYDYTNRSVIIING